MGGGIGGEEVIWKGGMVWGGTTVLLNQFYELLKDRTINVKRMSHECHVVKLVLSMPMLTICSLTLIYFLW